MSGYCASCFRPVPPVDVARDVLDLAAVVLSAGPQDEYWHQVALLARTPVESLQALSTVLLAVARPSAMDDVRHMAAMHQLQTTEGGR